MNSTLHNLIKCKLFLVYVDEYICILENEAIFGNDYLTKKKKIARIFFKPNINAV